MAHGHAHATRRATCTCSLRMLSIAAIGPHCARKNMRNGITSRIFCASAAMERAARSQRHPASAMQLLRPTPRSSIQQSRRRALEQRQARTIGRSAWESVCWHEKCSWSMSHRWLYNCARASTRAVSDARGEQWLIARASREAMGWASMRHTWRCV